MSVISFLLHTAVLILLKRMRGCIIGSQELTGAKRPHKQVWDCLGDEAFFARCISLPPRSTELCHALLQLWPFRCCLHMLVLTQLQRSLGLCPHTQPP